jgi:hypothetical protein
MQVVDTAFVNQPAGVAWARQVGASWLLSINFRVVLTRRSSKCSRDGPLIAIRARCRIRRPPHAPVGHPQRRDPIRGCRCRVKDGAPGRRRADRGTTALPFRRTVAEAADLLVSVVGRIGRQDLPRHTMPQRLSRRRLYRYRTP